MMWTFVFVVVFNNQYSTSIEYNSLEECLKTQYSVEENPSLLYYDNTNIKEIKYGCIKREQLGAGDESILHNSLSHYDINPIRGVDATLTRI